jgi:hypothetical protein
MTFINVIGTIVCYVGGSLLVIALLGVLSYWGYDIWLKKVLYWEDRDARKNLFYFIDHATEIREIIKEREAKR